MTSVASVSRTANGQLRQLLDPPAKGTSQSPGFGLGPLGTLAVIGLFVGVIPVASGMLWFPYIKTMSDRWLHAILLFAAGGLGFLAFDAGVEAFELAERVPGVCGAIS